MTRIIEFLIALGIVAGLFVVIGVCLPGERHISESIETNRKMTIVYDTVNSLRRFKDWNPLVLRDKGIELKYSGPDAGKGARMDYASTDGALGKGSWEITDSEENKRVVIAIEDQSKGRDKVTTFTLEPTGKNDRNVKITQEYSVDYGFDLFGRYAGLYVSRHIGDDMKMGLSRMANMLATVPNVDYRAAEAPLTDLKLVDVPAEDLLVVNAGNIDRSNESIRKSIQDNQEWIKRAMDANGLEAAGPVRIVTTDFGAEKYAFDVAQPVRKKSGAAAGDKKDGDADKDDKAEAPAVAAANGELDVKIPSGNPVTYVHTKEHRSAFASYTGHMAGLDVARNALRAWATTAGHEVVDRPYESWEGGVEKAFTTDGTYDVYWSVK
ncbi:SRPBCC family protein [Stenotrophomonas mori]|uniref:SRPBCC family protein n=1 Tax=Stenotrophomonas mori TaxID=2871096 RepID=A0ABT0SGC2_9GAMM|nr:SRPBCC family protein [Stenotrophomonas mori]MCL7714363.1 SRPBCC family protein [Stenotrophomonas mori]